MPKVSVSEAAQRLGVNVQRVHQRIADGSLPAERVGRQWVIDVADLVRLGHRPVGRPLSAKSAWVLAVVAASELAEPSGAAHMAAANIASSDRSRARSRLRELLDQVRGSHEHRDEPAAADVAASLRSLLRGRARRCLFRSAPLDLDDLRSDSRIKLSGISLPGSGIASGDIVEGYVADHDLDPIVNDFLLSDARHSEANVVLHVVPRALVPGSSVEPDNWLLLAADLAEHHRPREIARAAQVVRDAAERHSALEPKRSR